MLSREIRAEDAPKRRSTLTGGELVQNERDSGQLSTSVKDEMEALVVTMARVRTMLQGYGNVQGASQENTEGIKRTVDTIERELKGWAGSRSAPEWLVEGTISYGDRMANKLMGAGAVGLMDQLGDEASRIRNFHTSRLGIGFHGQDAEMIEATKWLGKLDKALEKYYDKNARAGDNKFFAGASGAEAEIRELLAQKPTGGSKSYPELLKMYMDRSVSDLVALETVRSIPKYLSEKKSKEWIATRMRSDLPSQLDDDKELVPFASKLVQDMGAERAKYIGTPTVTSPQSALKVENIRMREAIERSKQFDNELKQAKKEVRAAGKQLREVKKQVAPEIAAQEQAISDIERRIGEARGKGDPTTGLEDSLKSARGEQARTRKKITDAEDAVDLAKTRLKNAEMTQLAGAKTQDEIAARITKLQGDIQNRSASAPSPMVQGGAASHAAQAPSAAAQTNSVPSTAATNEYSGWIGNTQAYISNVAWAQGVFDHQSEDLKIAFRQGTMSEQQVLELQKALLATWFVQNEAFLTFNMSAEEILGMSSMKEIQLATRMALRAHLQSEIDKPGGAARLRSAGINKDDWDVIHGDDTNFDRKDKIYTTNDAEWESIHRKIWEQYLRDLGAKQSGSSTPPPPPVP